jgi:alanine-synthesizing transaminase
VLNYPANPTAYTATLDFYKEVVKFCKEHDMFILSDLAYSEIYFDGEVPPSVLEVPGAIDITVEFTSMSKTYSMPGWRVGFAVGNERLIAALARVKSYLDYGAFTPIQVAAATALNGDDKVIEEVRTIYRDRRDVMVESFARAGWNIASPKATMFAWTPIPDQFAHLGSLEFAKLLVQETAVVVSPGVGFGEYGDQYVRLALVENEQRIRQAARNIKKFLAGQPSHGNVVPLAATK